jgi:predicted RNase H-like nuclease (RuvC/YqgF family)
MCPIHNELGTLLTMVALVSGFINDPLDPTTLRTTTTTTTTPRPATEHPSQPSNPGEIPSAFKNQLEQMQKQLDDLTKQNSALKLQVTSLENDVTTLIQLQERVRHLEEDNLNTKKKLEAIQSSGSLTTRVQALESSEPEIRADISNLKLELGTQSRAFNSVTQSIQQSLDNVEQTVNQLAAGGSVTTIRPGGSVHVTTHASGIVTPAKTTPLTAILHGKTVLIDTLFLKAQGLVFRIIEKKGLRVSFK